MLVQNETLKNGETSNSRELMVLIRLTCNHITVVLFWSNFQDFEMEKSLALIYTISFKVSDAHEESFTHLNQPTI